MTPERNMAIRTAGNELIESAFRGRDDEVGYGVGLGGKESEARHLDYGVDGEGGAGFTLAVGAVAAMGYDGRG
jgi:hypothetical protein